MTKIFEIMLFCLICTIVIELLVAVLIKIRNKKDLLNILLVNIMTNPVLVSIDIYLQLFTAHYIQIIMIIIMEIIVVLVVEGQIYNKYLTNRKINPFIVSLILNSSSYGLGKIIGLLL